MKDLLLNVSGITETKLFMLDTIIKLAKGNNGFVGVGDLEYIKKNLIEEAKKGELDDVFTKMENEENE